MNKKHHPGAHYFELKETNSVSSITMLFFSSNAVSSHIAHNFDTCTRDIIWQKARQSGRLLYKINIVESTNIHFVSSFKPYNVLGVC